ncbi:hypothetical protein [Mariprofundus ferrooxydans]|uniref:hypothetical protein n=1 Tax=Mariprofundus ferrooxydans TaxID=314344 RepID=UPI00037CE24B|nr:hypothetical protein [Mariprofundus ferrooxydans]
MNKLLTLAVFSLREILAAPAYRALIASTVVIGIGAMAISNLFLLETIKVELDFLWLGMSLLATVYMLVVAVGLLAQDFTQGIAYLFLPHMSRQTYLLARISGIVAGLLLLLALMMLVATATVAWGLHHTPAGQTHGITWWSPAILTGMALLQSLTVLSIVIFTCSWASGLVEMILFSTVFTALAYLLPSVIQAMTSTEVMAQVPEWAAILIHAVDYLFPDMTGAQMVLAVVHGLPVPSAALVWFVISQVGYIMILSAVGFLIFVRRDL